MELFELVVDFPIGKTILSKHEVDACDGVSERSPQRVNLRGPESAADRDNLGEMLKNPNYFFTRIPAMYFAAMPRIDMTRLNCV